MITAAPLKWAALLSMLLDHTAAVLLRPDAPAYVLLRSLGRLALPLFLFLLLEGFRHSRSRKKYLLRLSVFALLSELPFDLALGSVSSAGAAFAQQNTMFTLSLGLACLMLLGYLLRAALPDPVRYALCALTALLAIDLAKLLCFDYGAAGITALLLGGAVRFLWETRSGSMTPGARTLQWLCLLLPLALLSRRTLWALSALPLIWLYGGGRGRQRWPLLFYAFYPAHLLLLALARAAMQ